MVVFLPLSLDYLFELEAQLCGVHVGGQEQGLVLRQVVHLHRAPPTEAGAQDSVLVLPVLVLVVLVLEAKRKINDELID